MAQLLSRLLIKKAVDAHLVSTVAFRSAHERARSKGKNKQTEVVDRQL